MPARADEFAQYCCELLSTLGPCVARRMFGGWGISTDGLTVAILADLGQGEKLWLKAGLETSHLFEAAGCERFTYAVKGKSHSMGYYSAPEEAMDSPGMMAPWASVALQAALAARPSNPKPKPRPAAKPKPKPKPKPKRLPGSRRTG
jgi:DNA transformation protein and related proteins